jgi:hypothetical protein
MSVNPLEIFINGGNTRNPANVFPQKKLTLLAKKTSTNICLRCITPSGNVRLAYYPYAKSYRDTVYLCIIDTHYFIDELVPVESINLGTKKPLTSWNLVFNLYDQGLIKLFHWSPLIEYVPEIIKINLGKVMGEQTLFKHTGKANSVGIQAVPTISYADIECIIRPKHIPMMYGRYCNDKYYSVSEGADTNWRGFKRFLEQFPDGKNIVYFHNLKYDWTVIKTNPWINIRSIIKKDGEYYSVTFTYFRKLFELRDSYKYIPKKLADFSSMFELQELHKHEYIMYELYTVSNTSTNDYIEYRDMLLTDIPEYTYNLTKTGLTLEANIEGKDLVNEINYIILDNRICVDKKIIEMFPKYFSNNRYYHLAHCEYYLHSDCELLYRGMEAYRKKMLNVLSIDCLSKITLPSMVHERMCQIGCYDNVSVLTDNLRRFASESISGGRVATKDNKMWDIRGKIHIIDGRSLYPSAIYRICNPLPEDNGRVAGFPIGEAQYITDWSKHNEMSHYIVRINITSITIPQQIAFVNYYDDNSRIYTNILSDKLKGIVVDKVTLEDWVKFQGITYEFIEGIRWTDGGNTKAGEFVKNLYDSRREFVSQGNISMGEICKLALNSLYGKTITKANTVKLVVKDKDKVNDYISNNFEHLIDMEECHNQSIISINEDDVDHSNMAHIGGLILSVARRIINEVLDVAKQLDICVLYTDTDSLHIAGDIDILIEAYRARFGRELIGIDLGQFGYELKYPGHTDIYSERAIILGKKAYLHVVSGINTDGIRETYNYCRMKGVNSYAMNEYQDKINLYERLYSGEKIPFDLTYGDAVMFQFKGSVITRETYIKKILFTSEKGIL